MTKHFDIKVRLSQIVGNLTSEGWRKTGSLGDCVVALKHPNGNRMTLIATEKSIAYVKNGRLVKTDDITAAAAAKVLESSLPPRYVEKPEVTKD